MTIEVNLQTLLFILFAALSATWALMKVLAVQFSREQKVQHTQLNARLDTLDAAMKQDTGQWQRVERELLNWKAEMPFQYVMRDDYLRNQSVIEAKLDGLASKLENAQLRAVSTTPKG